MVFFHLRILKFLMGISLIVILFFWFCDNSFLLFKSWLLCCNSFQVVQPVCYIKSLENSGQWTFSLDCEHPGVYIYFSRIFWNLFICMDFWVRRKFIFVFHFVWRTVVAFKHLALFKVVWDFGHFSLAKISNLAISFQILLMPQFRALNLNIFDPSFSSGK